MNEIRIAASDIVSAFNDHTIGSKVTDHTNFMSVAATAIREYDFASQKVPGQGFVMYPELVPFVSAGVGPRSKNASDYVCREHRGRVDAFLRREFAAPVTGCALVVYTRDAYFRDPDVTPAEAARIDALSPTHVLVAVLAFAGPESPLPPYRLVWNLAGGNLAAALWSAEEIHEKAKAAIAYDNEWVTVAD